MWNEHSARRALPHYYDQFFDLTGGGFSGRDFDDWYYDLLDLLSREKAVKAASKIDRQAPEQFLAISASYWNPRTSPSYEQAVAFVLKYEHSEFWMDYSEFMPREFDEMALGYKLVAEQWGSAHGGLLGTDDRRVEQVLKMAVDMPLRVMGLK